ncbi:MAG: ABC transporter ATP-binding protein [Thermoplasmatota archaeon]
MNALNITDLRKSYGELQAIDGLDLEVEEGAFFGLLGPNGAGKTTTIGTISGLVRPTAGRVEIFGVDAWREPAKARSMVGLCAQEPNFDDFLGLEQILAYSAGYYGVPFATGLEKARTLLKRFGLYEKRKQRTSTLSGGMKRRLLLARALMHDPKLLILDEPTAGVDVELRRSLWEEVQRLNDEGMTILLTTHYLEEAEALCDDVAVIDAGRMIERGHPDALRSRYGSKRVRLTTDATIDATGIGFELDGKGRWVREAPDAPDKLHELLAIVNQAGGTVEDLDVSNSRLEDVFVKLTTKEGK